MGWLTGRDTGTKARNDTARPRGRVRKCSCRRALTTAGKCPVCTTANAVFAAKGAGPVKHHCGRIMRGGICPNPDCP